MATTLLGPEQRAIAVIAVRSRQTRCPSRRTRWSTDVRGLLTQQPRFSSPVHPRQSGKPLDMHRASHGCSDFHCTRAEEAASPFRPSGGPRNQDQDQCLVGPESRQTGKVFEVCSYPSSPRRAEISLLLVMLYRTCNRLCIIYRVLRSSILLDSPHPVVHSRQGRGRVMDKIS